MTDSHGIPERVRSFIARYVQSIEHLEVLLLMYRRQPDWLTADEVSKEMYSSLMSAQEKLTDLTDDLLLIANGEVPLAYAFASQSVCVSDVAELATTYHTHRFTVMNLILSKPIKNVQLFSDAFRLRADGTRPADDG